MEELESSAASPKEAFRAPLLKEVNNMAIASAERCQRIAVYLNSFLYLAAAFINSKIVKSSSSIGPRKSGGSSVHTIADL
jgi:hypothetical protein